jgi:hypothetical protein
MNLLKSLLPYFLPFAVLLLIVIYVARVLLSSITTASQIDDTVLNSTIPHVNEPAIKGVVEKINSKSFEPIKLSP